MKTEKEAEDYLKELEEAYASIGSAGLFVTTQVLAPLRDRWNKGERSQELFNEIFEVSL